MDFFLFTENRIHRVFLCKVIYNFKQNSQPIKTSFFPRKFPIIYQPIASISSKGTLKQANVSMRPASWRSEPATIVPTLEEQWIHTDP
jgi:hypothetical protein